MKSLPLNFKRCVAMVLALVLTLSCANTYLALLVIAEDRVTISKTDGDIVAGNYDELTAAEKALLQSGLLMGNTYEHNVPNGDDELVTVDAESKTVTAESFEGWVPTQAVIVVNGSDYETVQMVNGTATFTYEGNAFSVRVTYKLEREIAETTQNTLLAAPGNLKNGLATIELVNEHAGKLTLLDMAIPSLKELADNDIETSLGTVGLTEAAKAAVNSLYAQYVANGEQIDLSALLAEYNVSKVKFLLERGTELRDAVVSFNEDIALVAEALETLGDNIDMLLNWGLVDQTTADQIATLANVTGDLNNALVSVPDADWTAAELGTSLVKDGITNVEYLTLDALVAALGTITTGITVKNPLTVSTTTITCNMSMWDVNINVVLTVVNPVTNEIVVHDVVTDMVTLADGAPASEVQAAADAVIAEAMTRWEGVYSAEHYVVGSATVIPETLNADLDYTVTYAPKTYTVSYTYGGDEQLPYGYFLKLPTYAEEHSDTSLVYDYYVNGEYYPEGAYVQIVDDIEVSRAQGDPYTQSTLYIKVGQRYFAAGSKGLAILTSGALLTDEALNVRYPKNEDKNDDGVNDLVSISGDVLTANSYPSSYNGLNWTPYTYTVITSNGGVEHFFAPGQTTVTITEADYTRVDVSYILDLEMSEGEITEILALAATLAEEADAQRGALNALAGYESVMGQLDMVKLGALNGVIDVTDLTPGDGDRNDPETQELRAYFKGVVNDLIANCVADNDYLNIYNIIVAYNDSNNGGLAYYYTNYETVINEINLLSGYLTAMLADDDKIAALEVLVGAAGFPEYADKISELEGALDAAREALSAPNAAIDLDSDNLFALTEALETEGTVEFTVDKEMWLYSDTFSVNSEASKTLQVTITVNGVEYKTSADGFTFDNGAVLTQGDVENLISAVLALADEKMGVLDAFYTGDFDAAVLNALVGKTALEAFNTLKTVKFNWAPTNYVVHIPNAPDATINVGSLGLTVILPDTPDAAVRYEYVIGGTVVNPGRYTFTTEQLATLFVDGEYTVRLNVIDIQRENLQALVDGLNESVGGTGFVFALVENNGTYSIVMKVDAENPAALTGAAMNFAMGLINSGYTYIGMDSNPVLYLDDNTLKISLQSVVDTVMDSGIGTQTIIDVINANGTVNNMHIPGTVISNTPMNTYGGKLVATTMQLGSNASNAFTVDFYITLGSAPAALTQVRSLLTGTLGGYFNVVCTGGTANVNLTLPGKAYEGYLAALLLTGNIDLTDIDAINGQIAFSFITDLLEPALHENVTMETYQNTLNKLGISLDVTQYEAIFEYLKQGYGMLDFIYDDDSCMADVNVPIAGILGSYAGDLAQMIVEYETGLDLSGSVNLTNIAGTGDFEALYFDSAASEYINMVGLTKNVSAMNFTGTTVVVLLKDLNGNLNLNGTTLLNLNGFAWNGENVGNGTVITVNSALTGADKGLYTLTVTDDEIVLELEAGMLHPNRADLQTMALNILADLAFNGYTSNKLYINDSKVYEIALLDLLAIYSGDTIDNLFDQACNMFSSEDLGALFNTLSADLTDFAALSAAVKAGEPILTYTVTTAPWTLSTEHVEDGNYVSASIVPGADTTRTLKVVIGGAEEDVDLVAAMLDELAETTDIDVSVDMSQTNADNTLTFDWSVDGSILVDLSENPGYALALSALLADSIGAPRNAALIAGIRAYYETGSMAALEAAFNAVTVAQAYKAVEDLAVNDNFAAIWNGLGLPADADVVELEAVWDLVAKQVARIVRYIDRDVASTRTLGSFLDGETYGFSRSNINRTLGSSDLFRGYGVILNAEVTNVTVAIKIFPDTAAEPETPEFVDGNGTPEITVDGENIFGVKVDTENMLIYIDAHKDGITDDMLIAAVQLYANNAESITVVIDHNDGKVFTGAVLTATATNGTESDTVEYVIIVMGDLNGNGRNDAHDASLILRHHNKVEILTGYAALAADMNQNGRIEMADNAIVIGKYVRTDWASYESSLM